MLLLLFSFFATSVWFQENPSPIQFPGKFIPVFFFASYVFWICSRDCFDFVPLDLNFTTFACKSWSEKHNLMFYIHDLGAPESWEVADLDESMSRLMLSSSSSKKDSSSSSFLDASVRASTFSSAPALSSLLVLVGSGMISEDSINQMDQFLREALQNPRERLSSELPRSRYCFSWV